MGKIDITVIGAGVVGLAIAAELSRNKKDIFVLEKNHSFGQETSSRNSEIIHAGIYYPQDSLKTKLCIEGRNLLYEFCLKHNINHQKIGKLIVATNQNEFIGLEELIKNGLANGVKDLKLITKSQIKNIEPNIEAIAAIYSPSTGIIDSHQLMKKFVQQIQENQGFIAYNSEVKNIIKEEGGYRICVSDDKGDKEEFFSRIVINSAGLCADQIWALLGLAKPEYKIKYCKGDYFRLPAAKSKLIKHLVYPVPSKYGSGLGIHTTLDLAGSMRLGPDDEYVDKLNYDINPAKARSFYESVNRFMPFVSPDDLSVDTAGIRPKLQGPGEPFRDFMIKDEADNGFAGFINLIGIESPGLTACLSIAGMVKSLAKKYF